MLLLQQNRAQAMDETALAARDSRPPWPTEQRVSAEVVEATPRDDSIARLHPEPGDFRDRYMVATKPGQYRTVDRVAAGWFTKQPR
jgi:hypothetical protein